MLFVVHLYQDREQRDLQQASAAGHGMCLSGADNSALQQIPFRIVENGAREGRDSYYTYPTNQPHLKSDFTAIFLALILKVAPPCTFGGHVLDRMLEACSQHCVWWRTEEKDRGMLRVVWCIDKVVYRKLTVV